MYFRLLPNLKKNKSILIEFKKEDEVALGKIPPALHVKTPFLLVFLLARFD